MIGPSPTVSKFNIGVEELKSLLLPVQLVLMDVDGVLTDGRFYFLPHPTVPERTIETKAFDSQDGIALQWLRSFKIAAGLISGRDSFATAERARTAGFQYVFQGNMDKKTILKTIQSESGIASQFILYIGDDFPDVTIMRHVRVAIAVANARPEVKQLAHFVTSACGGAGAVREVVELLLKAKGLWGQVLEQYEVADGSTLPDANT